jgi:hypothetical protein
LTALGVYDEIRDRYSKPAESPIQKDFDPLEALDKIKQILVNGAVAIPEKVIKKWTLPNDYHSGNHN